MTVTMTTKMVVGCVPHPLFDALTKTDKVLPMFVRVRVRVMSVLLL